MFSAAPHTVNLSTFLAGLNSAVTGGSNLLGQDSSRRPRLPEVITAYGSEHLCTFIRLLTTFLTVWPRRYTLLITGIAHCAHWSRHCGSQNKPPLLVTAAAAKVRNSVHINHHVINAAALRISKLSSHIVLSFIDLLMRNRRHYLLHIGRQVHGCETTASNIDHFNRYGDRSVFKSHKDVVVSNEHKTFESS